MSVELKYQGLLIQKGPFSEVRIQFFIMFDVKNLI